MATTIFVVVTVGLVRSHTLRVETNTLDQQTRTFARTIGASWQRALEEGNPSLCVVPDAALQKIVGRVGRIGLENLYCDLSPVKLDPLPPELLSRLSVQVAEAEGQQHVRADLAQFGGRTYIASASPILVANRAVGAFVIYRPYAEFATAWQDAVPRVLLSGLLGLVVALGLLLILSRRITRPLRLLSRASARVAQGDHDVRLGASGTVEIDNMANAFNAMVDQLAKRDRLSRDFLMRITHDLRTPLTAIRGHAAALSDGIVPPAQVALSLGAIESESLRLERMVSDLLDLTKMDADQMRIEPTDVDLTEVVNQACEAFEPAAGESGVEIARDVPSACLATTDPDRVSQVLSNLLDNALRWTPTGGVVTVRLVAGSASGAHMVLVMDTGPGVPAGERQKIFETFHSEVTPDGEYGSGLGLATGRLLARALGGDLNVGDAPSGGAAFKLTVPTGRGGPGTSPGPPAAV